MKDDEEGKRTIRKPGNQEKEAKKR